MIKRSKWESEFTVIPNEIINNPDLDWRDLGLIAYLLSKPSNWEVSISQLTKLRKAGRDQIYDMLRRLISAGYCVRKKSSSGEVDYLIFDKKQGANPDTEFQDEGIGKPNTEFPEQGLKQPNPENPDTENPTLIKKDYLINTDKSTRTLDELFSDFWLAYPKKRDKTKAQKAFLKISPDETLLAAMLDSIRQAKQSHDWQKENGQFVPLPTTWLNGKRWEDEFEVETENAKSKRFGESRQETYWNGLTPSLN